MCSFRFAKGWLFKKVHFRSSHELEKYWVSKRKQEIFFPPLHFCSMQTRNWDSSSAADNFFSITALNTKQKEIFFPPLPLVTAFVAAWHGNEQQNKLNPRFNISTSHLNISGLEMQHGVLLIYLYIFTVCALHMVAFKSDGRLPAEFQSCCPKSEEKQNPNQQGTVGAWTNASFRRQMHWLLGF